MNKFLLITKINLLQVFSLTKNNNSKFKSERKKKSLKTLGAVIIIGYILFYVYYLASSLMPTFIAINKPIYLLAFLFTISSVYIFFMNLFRVKNYLFDFKDYDLLMSLPISRNIVISSKIASQYIINLMYTFIIMIPGYIAYIRCIDLPNDGLFFLLLFAIPIIPILLSTILGIILTWIISFFNNKNFGSYIVNFLVIFVVLFISFKSSNLSDTEMVNQSINMVNNFGKYYYLTSLFASLLGDFNFTNMIIYLLSPVFFMMIFVVFINGGYTQLRNRLLKTNVKTNYEIEGYKKKSPIMSLYKKEIKKYFSNSLYVINTSFGCVILIVLIISMLLFNDSMITRFEKLLNMNEMISANIYLILSLLCVLSVTTNSSISLEGKSLWIMKVIPVSTDQIILSKIMVNLTILLPTVLISGTFFGIYLHLSFVDFLLIYLMPLAYSLLGTFSGLLFNLLFPKFEFDNEIRVIKQSLPVFLSILAGIIMVVVPLKIFDINTSSVITITSLIFIIDILLAFTIHFYGERKFIKL